MSLLFCPVWAAAEDSRGSGEVQMFLKFLASQLKLPFYYETSFVFGQDRDVKMQWQVAGK